MGVVVVVVVIIVVVVVAAQTWPSHPMDNMSASSENSEILSKQAWQSDLLDKISELGFGPVQKSYPRARLAKLVWIRFMNSLSLPTCYPPGGLATLGRLLLLLLLLLLHLGHARATILGRYTTRAFLPPPRWHRAQPGRFKS